MLSSNQLDPKCCSVSTERAVPLSQRDVKSDPKVVQEVSTATDNLLESLGSLAVEVDKQTGAEHTHALPHMSFKVHSYYNVCYQSSVFSNVVDSY